MSVDNEIMVKSDEMIKLSTQRRKISWIGVVYSKKYAHPRVILFILLTQLYFDCHNILNAYIFK